MGVTHFVCDVKNCGNIQIDDADIENYVENKTLDFGQGTICADCSEGITENMLYYHEFEAMNFLKEKYFTIKTMKNIKLGKI